MPDLAAVVGSRRGLHARPAALIAARATALGVDVTITRADAGAGPTAHAASVTELLGLALQAGERVVLRSDAIGTEGELRDLARMLSSELDQAGGRPSPPAR